MNKKIEIFIGRAEVQENPYFGLFVREREEVSFLPITANFYNFLDLVFNKSLEEVVEQNLKNLTSNFKYLPPVIPSKIIAVGLNYEDHAKEFGLNIPEEPIIFLKPPSAVIGHLDPIVYPHIATQVDFEAELAVVIGKKSKNINVDEAGHAVLGYTCANDVTERYFQKIDGQWTRAKGFDTFAPIGPWINTNIENENSLKIVSRVNGVERQSSSTSLMIFSPLQIVAFVSKIMTLFPGDVVLTGTPSGVGRINKGDIVEIEIESIGTLKNYVISEV
ncbi:MAG: fumarylacetoacetate hydrolase family protein [Actinobacteria bacterium]|nr:fumarylacetoacetate hydrolase family protein [Actinomycetota bacterium]